MVGYETWKAVRRQVRKGVRGLTIFAPIRVKSENTLDSKEEPDELSHRLLFRAVRVFDDSQTAGRPLPDGLKLLDGEDVNGSFARLQSLTVSREELRGELRGYHQSNEKRIVVASDLSGAQAVETLALELGHHFLGHTSYAENSRHDCELEAESVAFIVAGDSLVGISTGDYSFGYVAAWQKNDPKQAEQKIRECAERIQRASNVIIEHLEEVVQRNAPWLRRK